MAPVAVAVVCPVCKKTYAGATSLAKHVRTLHAAVHAHNLKARRERGRAVCHEDGCDFRCTAIVDLRAHLAAAHSLEFDEQTHYFDSYEHFLTWKSDEENRTNANFIKRGQQRARKHFEKTVFYCNRSGVRHESQSRGIRRPPLKGSTGKMGCACTATLVVRQQRDTGQVSVVAHLRHYGHVMDPRHVRLPLRERQRIAAQLRAFIPVQSVADVDADAPARSARFFKRVDLVSRQAVKNIARRYAGVRVRSERGRKATATTDARPAREYVTLPPEGEAWLAAESIADAPPPPPTVAPSVSRESVRALATELSQWVEAMPAAYLDSLFVCLRDAVGQARQAQLAVTTHDYGGVAMSHPQHDWDASYLCSPTRRPPRRHVQSRATMTDLRIVDKGAGAERRPSVRGQPAPQQYLGARREMSMPVRRLQRASIAAPASSPLRIIKVAAPQHSPPPRVVHLSSIRCPPGVRQQQPSVSVTRRAPSWPQPPSARRAQPLSQMPVLQRMEAPPPSFDADEAYDFVFVQ